MNRLKFSKKLIKIANKLDFMGHYNEANTLTKLAVDIYKEPNSDNMIDKDFDDELNSYDFPDLDDAFDGEITKLMPEKGLGIAYLGEDQKPVTFTYNPKKEYHIYETENYERLSEGFKIKIHPMGMDGGPEALFIVEKNPNDFLPFNPMNSGPGAMRMQSFMKNDRTLE